MRKSKRSRADNVGPQERQQNVETKDSDERHKSLLISVDRSIKFKPSLAGCHKTTPNPQASMVREGMRGDDQQQNHIFSYLSPEERVRKDHPLRAVRTMVDEVHTQLSRRFDAMYARVGRPSIAPEKLLRAQLLQMLYSIRSERLMEEMIYPVVLGIGRRLFDETGDKRSVGVLSATL